MLISMISDSNMQKTNASSLFASNSADTETSVFSNNSDPINLVTLSDEDIAKQITSNLTEEITGNNKNQTQNDSNDKITNIYEKIETDEQKLKELVENLNEKQAENLDVEETEKEEIETDEEGKEKVKKTAVSDNKETMKKEAEAEKKAKVKNQIDDLNIEIGVSKLFAQSMERIKSNYYMNKLAYQQA